MGSQFIEVKLGKDVVSLEYSPQRLLAASFVVAEAAIRQQEVQFMTTNFRGQVKEDIGCLLMVDVLGKQTLNEHLGHQVRGQMRCTDVDAGRAYWTFGLSCDECDGSGMAQTMKGRSIACPLCMESGIYAEVMFYTDLFGRFVGWDESPVIHYGNGGDPVYPLPEEQALAVVAGWWV